jgi:hypothetical protein
MIGIGLERDIGRAGAHQMHRFGFNEAELAGVALANEFRVTPGRFTLLGFCAKCSPDFAD